MIREWNACWLVALVGLGTLTPAQAGEIACWEFWRDGGGKKTCLPCAQELVEDETTNKRFQEELNTNRTQEKIVLPTTFKKGGACRMQLDYVRTNEPEAENPTQSYLGGCWSEHCMTRQVVAKLLDWAQDDSRSRFQRERALALLATLKNGELDQTRCDPTVWKIIQDRHAQAPAVFDQAVQAMLHGMEAGGSKCRKFFEGWETATPVGKLKDALLVAIVKTYWGQTAPQLVRRVQARPAVVESLRQKAFPFPPNAAVWTSDARKLTALGYFDDQTLRILRNAFFALHGHVFADQGLQDYFSKQPWYQPKPNKSIRLDPVERFFVKQVNKEEKRRQAAASTPAERGE